MIALLDGVSMTFRNLTNMDWCQLKVCLINWGWIRHQIGRNRRGRQWLLSVEKLKVPWKMILMFTKYLIETINLIKGKLRENKHRSISRLPGRRNGEEI